MHRGISPELGSLGRLMDAAQLRHRVVASNIANANSPGYTRREVRFEDSLRRALEDAGSSPEQRAQAIAEARLEVRRAPGGPTNPDGNNVLLEREIALMDRNRVVFSALTRAAQMKAAQYRAAIESR